MSVPAIVALAASLAARDHGGYVGYLIHRTSTISAGPFNRSDDVQLAVVFDDDRLAGLHVLRDVTNGREANATARKALAQQLRGDSAQPGFAVPFDSRYLSDYVYRVNGRTVEFSPVHKDARHAEGFFDVGPSGAVADLQYTPSVLPRFATSGTVREERAAVLPQFWATTRSRESYVGRYGILHGHGEFDTVNSAYHRFTDAASAKAWLQAESKQ